MKLQYFDLLSPNPIQLPGVGGIISPKLRDIAAIGYDAYQYYLAVLQMDMKNSFSASALPSDTDYNLFDLFIQSGSSMKLLQAILNFFIEEEVSYSESSHAFLVHKGTAVTGTITVKNYASVCEVILHRNYIRSRQEADISKAKNNKALEIMKKLQKGRTQKAKHTNADQNMELGNIISAVANKSQSLNMVNIWDLTVYQLWDCFSRLSHNSIYNIQSMSVAAWGDKDNHFDSTAWFKRIDVGD